MSGHAAQSAVGAMLAQVCSCDAATERQGKRENSVAVGEPPQRQQLSDMEDIEETCTGWLPTPRIHIVFEVHMIICPWCVASWHDQKPTLNIPMRWHMNNDNDNDNDTLREVPHPSNEGLALQARV